MVCTGITYRIAKELCTGVRKFHGHIMLRYQPALFLLSTPVRWVSLYNPENGEYIRGYKISVVGVRDPKGKFFKGELSFKGERCFRVLKKRYPISELFKFSESQFDGKKKAP